MLLAEHASNSGVLPCCMLLSIEVVLETQATAPVADAQLCTWQAWMDSACAEVTAACWLQHLFDGGGSSKNGRPHTHCKSANSGWASTHNYQLIYRVPDTLGKLSQLAV